MNMHSKTVCKLHVHIRCLATPCGHVGSRQLRQSTISGPTCVLHKNVPCPDCSTSLSKKEHHLWTCLHSQLWLEGRGQSRLWTSRHANGNLVRKSHGGHAAVNRSSVNQTAGWRDRSNVVSTFKQCQCVPRTVSNPASPRQFDRVNHSFVPPRKHTQIKTRTKSHTHTHLLMIGTNFVNCIAL